MKLGTILSTLLVMVFIAATPVAAQIETPAKQAVIIDVETGTVLLNKNADERMPTASMSKVMTLYMVFEELKRGRLTLKDEMQVSEKAWRMGGSKMFIKVGDKVKVEDLIRGVAIQSGNDATVALAEGIAGSEDAFAAAMTARAKEIGLHNSNFANASGWPDPNHYSTAADLAILAYRTIADFPEYYPYYAEREFTYNKIRQQNRDPLLGRVVGADGLKTGHTEEAGYGLIGSAIRDGRRIVMVINGLTSMKEREEESIRLMEWAFRNFEAKNLVKTGDDIETALVWLGDKELVQLVAGSDVRVLLPRAKRNDVKMSAQYSQPLAAPIKKGDEVGMLTVHVPDQPPVRVPLVAAEDVDKKGMFGRAKSRFEYLFFGTY